MSHRPKKYLGQNFLHDPRILHKIIQSCDLKSDEHVIEIGPGQGALTRLVAPLVKSVTCIEKDHDLISGLSDEFKGANVSVIEGDFLYWEFPSKFEKFKVIGNIPYNISTPIIERLIAWRSRITRAFLTVQLEFGGRLAAQPGSKDYGSLTCFVQYYAGVRKLFTISRGCFKPAPKVDSCMCVLDFYLQKIYKPKNEALLFKLIRTSFNQRRKTFVNSAADLFPKRDLAMALSLIGLKGNIRPEELTLENFIDISNRIV